MPGLGLAHIGLSSLTTALDPGAGGAASAAIVGASRSRRYLVCADISLGMLGTRELVVALSPGSAAYPAK